MNHVVLFAILTLAMGQTPPPQTESSADDKQIAKQRADAAIVLAQRHAAEYVMFAGADRKTKLKLHPQPILRWTNPVPQDADDDLAEVYGGVFIWTLDGRPEVVASIFKWYSPFKHVSHELQSLSLNNVIAERDAQPRWYPSRAGVAFKAVPNAPRPAETPLRRARQLKALAAEFSAQKFDSKMQRTTLRLLTQPLYRYKSTNPAVLDGALFVFAEGTDPEIVLLLEARKTDDQYRWQFAAARLNHLELRLSHKRRQVWSVRPAVPVAKRRDPKGTYMSIFRPGIEQNTQK